MAVAVVAVAAGVAFAPLAAAVEAVPVGAAEAAPVVVAEAVPVVEAVDAHAVAVPAEVARFLVVGLVVGLADVVVAVPGVAEVGVTVVAVAGTSGRRGWARTSTSAATVHATGPAATGVTAAVTARTSVPGKMRDPNVCKTFARGHHRV